VKKVVQGVGKVRTWDILFKEGDAISQALRIDLANLKKNNDYITNNLSEYNYIKSFFANSPTSNYSSYINRLEVNEGLEKHFDDFAEVEIVNSAGAPSGEFDGIDMLRQAFMEDKSAAGINTINPNTGQPYQTASQWAQNQIYNKTQTRINNLSNAVNTRPTVNGSPTVPSLQEIQGFKKLFFRIDYSDANLIQAVEDQLVNLRSQFPNWEFSAHLGG